MTHGLKGGGTGGMKRRHLRGGGTGGPKGGGLNGGGAGGLRGGCAGGMKRSSAGRMRGSRASGKTSRWIRMPSAGSIHCAAVSPASGRPPQPVHGRNAAGRWVRVRKGSGKPVVSLNFLYADGEKPGGAIISGSRRSVDFGIRLLPAHARKPFSIRAFGTAYAKAAAKAGSGAMPKGG